MECLEMKDDYSSNVAMDDTAYLSVGDTSFRSESSIQNNSPASATSDKGEESRKRHKKKRSSSKSEYALDKLVLNKSEIVFITDVNATDKTFFGQLTRNSNDDLKSFGEKVHAISEELFKKNGPVKKASRDQMVGARFSDGIWYRATVKDKSNTKRVAEVTFVDWGNSEVVSFDDMVEYSDTVDLHREPFGITCKYIGMKEASEEQIKKLFENFADRYLLVKPRDEIYGVWQVDVPMVGYNAHFWESAYNKWELVPSYPTDDPFRFYMEKERHMLDNTLKCEG